MSPLIPSHSQNATDSVLLTRGALLLSDAGAAKSGAGRLGVLRELSSGFAG